MRKYDEYDRLHAIALEQHGIFTASQARTAGVAADTVVKMVKRGRLERLAHGLYRDCGAPATRWTPYITAILWPLGATGVLSHETALAMMELSDANPARTHITVPKRHRPPPPAATVRRGAALRRPASSGRGIGRGPPRDNCGKDDPRLCASQPRPGTHSTGH